MTPEIILISGKQGSGKSTLVREFTRFYNKEDRGIYVRELRFASALYEMHDFCRDKLREYGLTLPDKNGRLLQLLGTEWARNEIGDSVWVDILQAQIERLERDIPSTYKRLIIVVSDCRFKNEFDAFPEALRIRLECDREARKMRCDGWRDTDDHRSETDLDDYAAARRFDQTFYTGKTPAVECAVLSKFLLDEASRARRGKRSYWRI